VLVLAFAIILDAQVTLLGRHPRTKLVPGTVLPSSKLILAAM